MKYKTAKAALAHSLLRGQTLNVKNCFSLFGITNCAREVSRMIEQPFGVSLTRTQRDGQSRYSQKVQWVDYTLNKARQDPKAIAAMQDYITKNTLN